MTIDMCMTLGYAIVGLTALVFMMSEGDLKAFFRAFAGGVVIVSIIMIASGAVGMILWALFGRASS